MVTQLLNHSKKLLSRQHNSILSAAFIIAASYASSALLGLVRNRLLASRFFGGLESHLDVYFAAFVLPDTLFQLLVVGALSAAFIPVYSQYLKKDLRQANDLANATLNSLLLTITILTATLIVFVHPVSRLVANFPPSQAFLLGRLMRLMLLSQLFFTVSTFLTGIIQSHRRFLIPALAPILYNLGIVIGILFLTPVMGIYGAAAGVVFGAFLHMLIQLPLARDLGFRYRLFFSPRHPGVRQISRLMFPRTLALAASQLERWIAVYLASFLTAGSLSLFNFARQLYILPISIFGVSLGQAVFPNLSSQADEQELPAFKSTLSRTLLQLLFLSLPASAILLILRVPLVRIVFGAKSFPWQATLTTARTLAFFTLSIAPQAATHILVRAFYALQNTRTPLIVSLVTVSLSLVLSLLFVFTFHQGTAGLALAITLSNILGFVWLIGLLQRRLGRLLVYSGSLKMLLATILTGIFLWIPLRLLDRFVFDTTRTLPLVALTLTAGTIGMLVYFLISYWLKIPELKAVLRLASKLGNWRQILSSTEEIIEPSSLDE